MMFFCVDRIIALTLQALLVATLALATSVAQGQGSACTVTTIPLVFGNYDVSAVAPLVTASKIEVRCAARMTLTLGIEGGNRVAGSSGSRAPRHISAGDTLTYHVYQDSSLSQSWGNGLTAAGRTLTAAAAQTVFVYGVLPAGQDVLFGEYRDTLSIVVLP